MEYSDNIRILIITEDGEFDGRLREYLAEEMPGGRLCAIYNVDSAADRYEALAQVKQSKTQGRPYALMFLDLSLQSRTEGFSLCRRVWEALPDTIIILCLDDEPLLHRRLVEELGISDNLLVLCKPVSRIAVKQTAMAMLARWNLAVSVRCYCEELEKTVETRTHELNETVAQLVQANNDLSQSIRKTQASEQRMLESNKFAALGEMAGGIAHEINTPLATIQLASEQVKELLSDSPFDAAAVDQMLVTIGDTTSRIASIVTGLRKFSREAGGDPSFSEEISKIIDDTLGLCRSRFKSEKIALTIEKPSHAVKAFCRPVQIVQVLLNLLNNARDAIADLPEKWIRIAVSECGEMVVISVTDSGHGIAPEVQKKIFQPFFTTKPIGKGTGLGLSVSKGILESQGGRIELDASDPHTKMLVYLPKKYVKKEVA